MAKKDHSVKLVQKRNTVVMEWNIKEFSMIRA